MRSSESSPCLTGRESYRKGPRVEQTDLEQHHQHLLEVAGSVSNDVRLQVSLIGCGRNTGALASSSQTFRIQNRSFAPPPLTSTSSYGYKPQTNLHGCHSKIQVSLYSCGHCDSMKQTLLLSPCTFYYIITITWIEGSSTHSDKATFIKSISDCNTPDLSLVSE